MQLSLEKILANVLKKTTPSKDERQRILSLADTLVRKVEASAKRAGVKAKVRVEGSVAKDTWLRGEPDIDIFMQVPTSTPREAFGTVYLQIAKEATKGFKQVERFAEHPYLEAFVNSTRVNIVPCYRTKLAEWLSATDRTPYHTDFVKPKLNDKLRGEIRLLKRFMKGIGVYGAEIKVGGFSGYLCEILILHHGTFVNALEAAAAWRKPWIIDYAGYCKGREDEIPKIFSEPLVVVDPVDKGRNVASAVRQERLIEFVAASRRLLQRPSKDFFYPKPTEAMKVKQLVRCMKARGNAIVFVKIGRVKAVPDILWGQLYKTQRSLHQMLVQNDFCVVKDAVWSDEKALNLLLFEVENRLLPLARKHFGPPIDKRAECERFLNKHRGAPSTVSGPRLENGRWVVETKRKHTDVVELLKEKLREDARQVGVAGLISKALMTSRQVLVNEEITKTYLSHEEFAEFLTEYLIGKPKWL